MKMLKKLGKNYQKKMWVRWAFCGFGGFDQININSKEKSLDNI